METTETHKEWVRETDEEWFYRKHVNDVTASYRRWMEEIEDFKEIVRRIALGEAMLKTCVNCGHLRADHLYLHQTIVLMGCWRGCTCAKFETDELG